MSSEVYAQPLPAQRTWLVALLAGLAGVVAMLAVFGIVYLSKGSGGDTPKNTFRPADHSFSIAIPDGWTALPRPALEQIPGSPAAVLRRSDGHGTVVVRRSGEIKGDLRTVANALTAQLRGRFPGFRLVSARLGRLRAGGAFLYTFTRGRYAQSLAVTRVKDVTYRIDSIVPAGSPEVARQAGAIVGSFGS